MPNTFADFAATLMAVGTIQSAFDGHNVITSFIELNIQHFNIG
jgi:hypothetical protein